MMLNVSATLSPSRNKDTRTQVREQLEKEHAGVSPSAIKNQLVSDMMEVDPAADYTYICIRTPIPLVAAVRDDTALYS